MGTGFFLLKVKKAASCFMGMGLNLRFYEQDFWGDGGPAVQIYGIDKGKREYMGRNPMLKLILEVTRITG